MSGNYLYHWEKYIYQKTPEKDISNWSADFGPRVVQRDEFGKALKVEFRLLLLNSNIDVYVVGDFNGWRRDMAGLEKYKLTLDEHGAIGSVVVDGVKHGDSYKFLVVSDNTRKLFHDPAGFYFNDMGNTVFWDFEDSSCYKQRFDLIDNTNRSIKIMQTDLPGLISHFANKEGVCGRDVSQKDYYNFISDSGIIEHIKELGFNTVQFLPFAQSIDGDNWKFRYLVPFQFAIQKNWGNPNDFARMIDKFHEAGIAVIGDFVIGHMPFIDFNLFGQDCHDNGIHVWKKEDGNYVYLKDKTTWGTIRPDYENIYVRKFFIDSCLSFLKNYRIDGYRIDNVDGIIRFGDNGDGPERPSGRTFLRELNSSIYSYNPYAMINYEAHYFYEDNAKMLVVPMESDERALGATAYNESRITYFFHSLYMPKAIDELSVWKVKEIIDEKEWGQSNSTVADFHNHDAAAGLMEMRCTGSYAYDTMTCKQPHNHFHALGKIKVMEGIISFIEEGRTLDLMQTFLLQTGTFEHDSSIHWFLTFNELNRNVVEYKRKVNEIMDDIAFWPRFVSGRSFLNLDDKNKVLVVERFAEHEGKRSRYIIVINMSAWRHHDYRVGVRTENKYRLVLNSDEFKYAGFGMVSYPEVFENFSSNNFELLSREIRIGQIAPYGVVVLKEVE